MIPLTEARSIIARAVQPLAPVILPLSHLHGRILREPVAAGEDFPGFDRSAMDGYAVSANDDSTQFRVVGEIQAGVSPGFGLARGECARIFTGAQLPRGGSQVIMQEDVICKGEWMIPQRRSNDTHIRKRGDDALLGTVLASPGARLGPGELALFAQIGAVQATVSPAPRVLHLTTGNELAPPEETPGPGQIRDSNSTLIAALLREQGALLAAQKRCGDDLRTLVDGVQVESEDDWDLLLISGGASVGDYDFGRRALTELGFEVHFPQIRVRPGKPLVFATRGRHAAFVVPGNPVSHFVTFHLAIRAALECLQGLEPSWPLVKAALDGALEGRPDSRETFWPASLRIIDRRLRVRPLTWRSSGDLCGLVGANALIRIGPESSSPAAGGTVDVLVVASFCLDSKLSTPTF